MPGMQGEREGIVVQDTEMLPRERHSYLCRMWQGCEGMQDSQQSCGKAIRFFVQQRQDCLYSLYQGTWWGRLCEDNGWQETDDNQEKEVICSLSAVNSYLSQHHEVLVQKHDILFYQQRDSWENGPKKPAFDSLWHIKTLPFKKMTARRPGK